MLASVRAVASLEAASPTGAGAAAVDDLQHIGEKIKGQQLHTACTQRLILGARTNLKARGRNASAHMHPALSCCSINCPVILLQHTLQGNHLRIYCVLNIHAPETHALLLTCNSQTALSGLTSAAERLSCLLNLCPICCTFCLLLPGTRAAAEVVTFCTCRGTVQCCRCPRYSTNAAVPLVAPHPASWQRHIPWSL